jgi:phosphoglycerate dehydrogenase-like enzyme
MSKPKILIDPQPRTMDLIFDSQAQRQLSTIADLTVFDAGPMPVEMLEKALPEAEILIGQTDLPRERLERACGLRAIFNVEGNFLPNVDYDHCFSRNIRVLIASPAFAVAVAETSLALGMDLARGITKNDRAFRERNEEYGFESNTSVTEIEEDSCPPKEFIGLKNGGKKNDYVVEGILFQSGRLWNRDQRWTVRRFRQT